MPVNDSYPWNFFEFRSNDGSHKDKNFAANRAWSDQAVAAGKLFGYIVYYFYRPGVDGAAVLRSQVGTPNPRMVAMIDVESAGGQVKRQPVGHDQPTVQRTGFVAWRRPPCHRLRQRQ